MGYDVTYHPISEIEMKKWYFDRLQEIKMGNLVPAQELAKSFGMQDFYIDKYITTLRAGVASKDNGRELFDKTHGFYVAVVQGLFRTYFYTRGSAFSFLIDEKPEFQKYTKSWQDILETVITCPLRNKITENYCSGIYLPYEQVKQLFEDYTQISGIKEALDTFFSEGRIDVFLKAVVYSLEHQLGLLEATEVAEPNPMDLNRSESYSDFFNHCDQDGPYLYRSAALQQLKEARPAAGEPRNHQLKKKGFFSNLFRNR